MVKTNSSNFNFSICLIRPLQFTSTTCSKCRQSSLRLILLYRVRLKQNKYSVLFLSNGPTKRYTPYKDWRCTTFQNGISFALFTIVPIPLVPVEALFLYHLSWRRRCSYTICPGITAPSHIQGSVRIMALLPEVPRDRLEVVGRFLPRKHPTGTEPHQSDSVMLVLIQNAQDPTCY